MAGRCSSFLRGSLCGLLFVGAVRCAAQELKKADATRSVPATEGASARNDEMMAPARGSVEKGLKYLASRQQEDGAFATSGYGRNAAVVALAGMTWLASGSTPGRGPYG